MRKLFYYYYYYIYFFYIEKEFSSSLSVDILYVNEPFFQEVRSESSPVPDTFSNSGK